MNSGKRYEYDAVLHKLDDNGGAYVAFPWNIREEFGKGRVKVHALFDGGMKDKDDIGQVS